MTDTGNAQNLWWTNAVVYQLYPRSFADSNGDGKGDFEGIRSHLDHLRDLGIDAIWLSPCFPSPQRDHGYDVADYFDVEPVYGNLDDFDRLVAAAKERGIRTHLDLNRPIYARTSAYGHFGRTPDNEGGFSWEKTDLVEPFKRAV